MINKANKCVWSPKMKMKNSRVALFLSWPLFFFVQELATAATITFTNNCSYTVWPGILTNDPKIQLPTTGFQLAVGASKSVSIPSPWSGQMWARTGCSNDSGIFVCVTGDCGSGHVGCDGAGASPPAATFAELTTAPNDGQDFYDVSNLNGFNLPMSIAPSGGNGSCKSSSCPANITPDCPEELQVRWWDGSVIACKSACLAFNQSQYCCTGEFLSRDSCSPTTYSQFYQRHCPDAYSYVYDDTRLSSNFTCSGRPDYIVTFCPNKPNTGAAKRGGATVTFKNKCSYTVWPATLTTLQSSQLSTTGFELATGASSSVDVPSAWVGRFWARTGCSSKSGRFTCATGDCGSGQVSCKGSGGNPPATLSELAIGSTNGQDFYDVSNVDGFNLPMSIDAEGGNSNCKSSSCPANINSVCPAELLVKGSDGNVIACKSACMAFNQPQYCCTGNFSTAETCSPTTYTIFFQKQCPAAYSYPYDDISGTFTCSGGPNYVITFCP